MENMLVLDQFTLKVLRNNNPPPLGMLKDFGANPFAIYYFAVYKQ
jgi:hypothetical protein